MFTETVYNIVARKVGTVPKNAENKLLVYTITLTIVLIAIFINPGTLTLCIFINFFPPPVLLVYPVQ